MKIRITLSLVLIILTGSAFSQIRRQDFTEILQEYVLDGKVNYKQLCQDARLTAYLQKLSRTNPDTIRSDADRLAFWLNAYNAFTLKIICDNYPVKSINDLHFGGLVVGTIVNKTVWDKEFITINGQAVSLNHIEHDIIRKAFKEPRAHFALVCASISCPPLRSEAFEGFKLEQQLTDQGRVYLNNGRENRFDKERRIAYLSKILDWYAGDFGRNDAEVLLYVARFLPGELALDIKENIRKWKIKYTDYAWGLNE